MIKHTPGNTKHLALLTDGEEIFASHIGSFENCQEAMQRAEQATDGNVRGIIVKFNEVLAVCDLVEALKMIATPTSAFRGEHYEGEYNRAVSIAKAALSKAGVSQ